MKKERYIKKISIIISKNRVEDVLPGLIMAHGARMEGIDVLIFFTSYGLDVIHDKKMDNLKLSNPDGEFTPEKFKEVMEKYDIPTVREFIEMIHDSGAKMYACRATIDIWGIREEDLCPEVDGILSVGQFYTLSDDAQHIIFT